MLKVLGESSKCEWTISSYMTKYTSHFSGIRTFEIRAIDKQPAILYHAYNDYMTFMVTFSNAIDNYNY